MTSDSYNSLGFWSMVSFEIWHVLLVSAGVLLLLALSLRWRSLVRSLRRELDSLGVRHRATSERAESRVGELERDLKLARDAFTDLEKRAAVDVKHWVSKYRRVGRELRLFRQKHEPAAPKVVIKDMPKETRAELDKKGEERKKGEDGKKGD